MNRLDRIQMIESRIQSNKQRVDKLDKLYIKAFAPKGYGGRSSYEDYDCISGRNKILHVEDYYNERERLLTLIDLDEAIVCNLKNEIHEDLYLRQLDNIEDKVRFLRVIRGYTQEVTAEKLYITDRHVRRIERKMKE